MIIKMYSLSVRTTVSLDPDVVAAVQQLRETTGVGLSEAINQLVRHGLTASTMRRHRFSQLAAESGLRVDVTNIADVLESLDARP